MSVGMSDGLSVGLSGGLSGSDAQAQDQPGEQQDQPGNQRNQPGNPPLVSIVLPVYNGARYLPEALASIVAQSYPHWELVCVDDASTDETPALLAAWAAREPRLRVLRHAQNQRLPAALNTGFAAARGALLTWTSDDNRYQPTALATLVAALQPSAVSPVADGTADGAENGAADVAEGGAEPPLDFVYSDYEVIDAAGQVTETTRAPEPLALVASTVAIPCFLYRRRVYERLGDYAVDLALAEDYDYWLRMLAAGLRLQPLHEPLYAYRRHGGSLTDTARGRTFAMAERALLRNQSALVKRYPTLRGAIYLQLAAFASWRGQRGRAAIYALQGARYRPRALARQTQAYLWRRLSGSRA